MTTSETIKRAKEPGFYKCSGGFIWYGGELGAKGRTDRNGSVSFR